MIVAAEAGAGILKAEVLKAEILKTTQPSRIPERTCDAEKFKKLYFHFYKKFMMIDSKLKIKDQQINTLNYLVSDYQKRMAAMQLQIAELNNRYEMVTEPNGAEYLEITPYPLMMTESRERK